MGTPWPRGYRFSAHARRANGIDRTSAKDELVKLATRLVVEEALEGEAGDAVGRAWRAAGPGISERVP